MIYTYLLLKFNDHIKPVGKFEFFFLHRDAYRFKQVNFHFIINTTFLLFIYLTEYK